MDPIEFFGLEQHGELRWQFDVAPRLATAGKFLFGGCGLGAAITALEASVGRRVVWASAQYLAFAGLGERCEAHIDIVTSGHYTTQARLTCRADGREIFFVVASLGERPNVHEGQWEQCPTVPPPQECLERTSRWDMSNTVMETLDVRLARGLQWEELGSAPGVTHGQSALWLKPHDLAVDTASLAIMGDYVPFGISQALSQWTHVNSLDNTLRMIRHVPTEWVLLDVRIHGVRNGFGHGLVHLWSQDGTLMATASQSAVVRSGEITVPPARG